MDYRVDILADSIGPHGVRLTVIYALADPRTDEIRYVGKTSASLTERLRHHLKEAREGVVGHKCNWLRQLMSEGLMPEVGVLEVVRGEGWRDREKYWIGCFRDRCNLTNLADGGQGSTGYRLNDEQRARQSAALRKPKPPGFGAKIAAYRTGRKASEETRRKISDIAKARVITPERRALLAEIAKRPRPSRRNGGLQSRTDS